MDILVIEGAASRRVAVAQYLLRTAHRVTISSSIEEAREILQFITKKSEAPDAVVIGDSLVSRDATSFREEIADRFAEAAWVPLPPDRSLQWLGDWLQSTANRMATRRRRSVAIASLTVEAVQPGWAVSPVRQVAPPTNARSTPGPPVGGVLSKTARAAPLSLMPKPLRPAARQKGVG